MKGMVHMKKTVCMVLAVLLVLSLTACGSKSPAPAASAAPASAAPASASPAPSVSVPPAPAASASPAPSKNPDALPDLGGVEVDEGLLDVTLTIPAELSGEVTQEELDATAKEKGYKSAKLNDDGSVTYVMTRAKHKEMMAELTKTLNDGLNEMAQSEDFPSFVSVKANDDFTDFKVVINKEELGLVESFSTMAFYTYGAMYNAFAGKEVENIHVAFVNEATGNIIQEANSSDMK